MSVCVHMNLAPAAVCVLHSTDSLFPRHLPHITLKHTHTHTHKTLSPSLPPLLLRPRTWPGRVPADGGDWLRVLSQHAHQLPKLLALHKRDGLLIEQSTRDIFVGAQSPEIALPSPLRPSAPTWACQIRIWESMLPEASSRSSQESPRSVISPVWPGHEASSCPCTRSQSFTQASSAPVAASVAALSQAVQ